MSFQGELMQLINRHNLEARYDIPDAVLAKYLCDCHAVLGENLVRLRLHEARKTSVSLVGCDRCDNIADHHFCDECLESYEH